MIPARMCPTHALLLDELVCPAGHELDEHAEPPDVWWIVDAELTAADPRWLLATASDRVLTWEPWCRDFATAFEIIEGGMTAARATARGPAELLADKHRLDLESWRKQRIRKRKIHP